MIENLSQKLAEISNSLGYLLPETLLALGAFVFLLLEMILPKIRKDLTIFLSALGFTLIILISWGQLTGLEVSDSLSLLGNHLILDRQTVIIKILISVTALLSSLLLYHSSIYYQRRIVLRELIFFLWLIVLGLNLLLMSANWLSLYLSLELVSIASYILTAFHFNKKSAEGSLKYLLFGALSSGIMLYGISLLYGLTGTLYFLSADFAQALTSVPVWVVTISLLMALGGLLFKIAVFPFHIWAPDVYEAAPTPIVAFFSTAPKIVALFVLMKIASAETLLLWEGHSLFFINLLSFVALASLTIGNFGALWQMNLKRLLAYSSIAHSGFLMIAVIVNKGSAWESFAFYSGVYVLMNFAAFHLVEILSGGEGKNYLLNDLNGRGKQGLWLGILFTIVVIALVGLPPTAGFNAKLLIFSILWEKYTIQPTSILLLLFIFGLLNAGVSLFYYLRIPYALFFKEESPTISHRGIRTYDYLISLLIVLPLLILFFQPHWLILN